MSDKKYKFCGMILRDGDTFKVQEEKKGNNKYNPSGIGIYTFHPESFNGVEELV